MTTDTYTHPPSAMPADELARALISLRSMAVQHADARSEHWSRVRLGPLVVGMRLTRPVFGCWRLRLWITPDGKTLKRATRRDVEAICKALGVDLKAAQVDRLPGHGDVEHLLITESHLAAKPQGGAA